MKTKLNIYQFKLYKYNNIDVYNVIFSNINTKKSNSKHYPIINSGKEDKSININNILISKHMQKLNYTKHSRIDDNDLIKIYNNGTVIATKRRNNINNNNNNKKLKVKEIIKEEDIIDID